MDIRKVRLRHLPLAYHRRGGAALLELCTCAWAVGPKLGRQPQRCKLVLHLVQGLVRRRRALSTGTTIARWSDRASWLGLRRRGRNHWLRVRELLLSCSPAVVSRGEHSGPCSLNWGSAPCGHMRQITERRVAMYGAPSRERMRHDRVWGGGGDQRPRARDRLAVRHYLSRSFFPGWQVSCGLSAWMPHVVFLVSLPNK